VVVALAACVTESGEVAREGDRVWGTGSVRYIDLESGFYAIRGDDGRIYTPLELPEAFQRDHLRVRFTARLRPDILTIVLTGELVEIISIERIWPFADSPSDLGGLRAPPASPRHPAPPA